MRSIGGRSIGPRSAAVILAAIVLASGPPASAEEAIVGRAMPMSMVDGDPAPAALDPCVDQAYTLGGWRWTTTFQWSLAARPIPANLRRKAVVRSLVSAMANMTDARNDCGRPDQVSATALYLGVTDRQPGVTATGGCGASDGWNVVGFGRLPKGITGLTCVWTIGDQIVEADVKLNTRFAWATTLATCDGEVMVEAVATHEFGHVLGLDHVRERVHGRLTMSPRLDGRCELAEATLGLGDLLGLEALY